MFKSVKSILDEKVLFLNYPKSILKKIKTKSFFHRKKKSLDDLHLRVNSLQDLRCGVWAMYQHEIIRLFIRYFHLQVIMY